LKSNRDQDGQLRPRGGEGGLVQMRGVRDVEGARLGGGGVRAVGGENSVPGGNGTQKRGFSRREKKGVQTKGRKANTVAFEIGPPIIWPKTLGGEEKHWNEGDPHSESSLPIQNRLGSMKRDGEKSWWGRFK